MQRLSGNGLVFVEIDGTCSMDIEKVQGGLKNMAFGGERLFNTVVTGPGKITVQTMPKSAFVNSIVNLLPTKSS